VLKVIKHTSETSESTVAPFGRPLIKTNESAKITIEASTACRNVAVKHRICMAG